MLTPPMTVKVPAPILVTVPEPERLPVQAKSVGVLMRKEPPRSTFKTPPVMADKVPGLNSKLPARILMAPLTQPVAVLMTSVPAPTLVSAPEPLSGRVKVAVPLETFTERLPARPTLIAEVFVRVLWSICRVPPLTLVTPV